MKRMKWEEREWRKNKWMKERREGNFNRISSEAKENERDPNAKRQGLAAELERIANSIAIHLGSSSQEACFRELSLFWRLLFLSSQIQYRDLYSVLSGSQSNILILHLLILYCSFIAGTVYIVILISKPLFFDVSFPIWLCISLNRH